jgi:glycosyltransferase involved in cell wall biosynthesis
MKPDLSIILPSIRPHLLKDVYDSILESTSRHFELIIISPYPLPEDLLEHKNIKYVRDFGSPVRAHNIGLLLCEAMIITWMADDGIMLPNSIDEHMNLMESLGDDEKNVVVTKYYEGQKNSKERDTLQPDSYFKIINTPAASPYLPPDWWIFNVGYMHRKFAYALGGWDCSYEGTWVAHTDMAIRAQAAGANVVMSDHPRDVADHMPGETGDHKPIYECQTFHDEPLIQKRYRRPDWKKANDIAIRIMNWKDAPAVWERRFKDE